MILHTSLQLQKEAVLQKSFFRSVQQKIEENEEDWQSPKGSELERQCV